jgi:hypothetical protein
VSSDGPAPTFERFKDGWVVVDPAGVIATPTPMPEQKARAYARVLRVPFPGDTTAGPPEEAARELLAAATGSALRYLDFVLELAPDVDLWQRMQDEHVANPSGFCRARVCGRGGYGTPCLPWPCPTRLLADWAWGAHHRRSATGREPG